MSREQGRSVDLAGPLRGLRVIEMGAIGPVPLCAMLLADLGADVLRVDRVSHGSAPLGIGKEPKADPLRRGRRSISVDLKHVRGRDVILRLVETADVMIEGYRPGVAERLGIGPDQCLDRNPRLIYGRMTGWGQDGPLANAVGHDLNYIALNGLLGLIGRAGQPPTPPLNLVGDGGGGGLMLAFGVLAALFERTHSNIGQVIDAAMIEGSAVLATAFFGFAHSGDWSPERGSNLVDSGAPFYDAYETGDGRWLSVAALEPRFYQALLQLLGLEEELLLPQHDRAGWPETRRRFAETIRTRTRDEWCGLAYGTEACVAPILGLDELEHHPHLQARESFIRHDGVLQPAPAPRFSRTPGTITLAPAAPGEHTVEALTDWGFESELVTELEREGAIATVSDPL